MVRVWVADKTVMAMIRLLHMAISDRFRDVTWHTSAIQIHVTLLYFVPRDLWWWEHTNKTESLSFFVKISLYPILPLFITKWWRWNL